MPEAVTLTVSDEFVHALREVVRQAITAELVGVRNNEPGFLDVDGAADFLASTPSAIRSLVKREAIPHYKTPAGRLLFVREELRHWVTSSNRTA